MPALGEERLSRLYPIGSIWSARGAVLCLRQRLAGQHAEPAAGDRGRGDPRLVGGPRRRAVRRLRSGSTLQAALAAFTRGAAFVNRDDEAGTIAAGMRADLAVLDRNLFEGGPVGEARVELTIAGGAVVHEA